jgi:pilus assembly protein CpaE
MKSVLVVDDDPNIGKLLDFSLQRAGFSVIITQDGQEGLEMAAQHRPDVAVLDVMMPGIHGYEVCRRLRADPNTAHAKIVFLTARAQPIDEQEALKAGADMFLSKPVVPDELVGHIQSLLLEERPSVPAASEPAPAAAPTVPAKARLIVCFSPMPNAGVTALAANLALAFAVSAHIKVPLVELHDEQTDVLSAFGLPADAHRGNLLATGRDLNRDTLQLHLVEHPSGVRILPAPPDMSDVPPALSETAVSLLRDEFPVVIVDAKRALDARVKPVFLAADLVLLLTTPEVPAIRSMLQAIQAFQKLGFPDRQILVVVNNVRPRPGVPVAKLAEGIKRPIFGVIPHEPAMVEALRSGRPLIALRPKSPASQAIGRMTVRLARGFRLI